MAYPFEDIIRQKVVNSKVASLSLSRDKEVLGMVLVGEKFSLSFMKPGWAFADSGRLNLGDPSSEQPLSHELEYRRYPEMPRIHHSAAWDGRYDKYDLFFPFEVKFFHPYPQGSSFLYPSQQRREGRIWVLGGRTEDKKKGSLIFCFMPRQYIESNVRATKPKRLGD